MNNLSLGLVLVLCGGISIVMGDYMGRLCGTQFGSGTHDHYYPQGGSAVRECIDYCHKYNRKYAALLFGHECFCDDSLDGYHLCTDGDDSAICLTGNCTLSTGMLCSADDTMICGDTTWYSLYNADKDNNIITRWSTVVNEVCSSLDETCNWYCDVSDKDYLYATGKVYGTDVYDIKSSYCLAAAHSLRYKANQLTQVVIQRSTQTSKLTLEGSWRYGIAAQWDTTEHTFTVQTPSENYDFGSSVLFGFVNMGTRTLTCKSYGGSVDVFAATLDNQKQPSASDLPLSTATEFFCGLEASSGSRYPATYVPVITQASAGNEVIAQNRTITINEGDELVFSFETSSLSNGPFAVFKQNDQIVAPSSDSTITVRRTNAQTYFSGFYRLVNSRMEWEGSVRAIVVPKNDDLSVCSGFRGYPREDGTCLCVPPFGGDSKCSQVCKKNTLDGTFGPNCDMNCGSNACKGQLICGEDPFGCHCGSGWTGDDCTTECPEGTYGPDCKGHASGCHCLQMEGCSRVTGECPFGCVWGWYGDSCTTEGGYIETAPYIISTGYSDIQVGWNAWDKGRDQGDVEPDCYWLEYKLATDSDAHYKNTTSTCFKSGATTFTDDVTGLDTFTTYSFRVRTVVTGEITPTPSDSVDGTTICEIPVGGPKNLDSQGGVRSIEVTWDWPDKKYWRCNEVIMHCDYSCLFRCGTSKTPMMSFEVNSTTQQSSSSSYLVSDLPPHATCDFACYLTLGCGRNGPITHMKNIKNADGPPTEVLGLGSFSDTGGLLTAWEVPYGEDNHVLTYNVEISDRTGTKLRTNTTMYRYKYEGAVSGELYTVTLRAITNYGLGAASSIYARYFKPLLASEKDARNRRSGVMCNDEVLAENEKLINQITLLNEKLKNLEATGKDNCKDITQNTYGISMIVLAILCAVFLMAFFCVTCMYFKSTGKGKLLIDDTASS